MKSRTFIFGASGLIVSSIIPCLLSQEAPMPERAAHQPIENVTPVSSDEHLTTKAPKQEPGGPYAPSDPRWLERTRKLKSDPLYEWKTPIEFYGKVIDQEGKPIEGASASVSWTDMSAKGSSQMEKTSDSSGLFSITGIQGKHMTVQVNKEGYYRQLSGTTSAFEYAGFWEPSYHIPDKAKPVIFRLRKKGKAAALANASGKIVLEFGKAVTIPIPREVSSNAVLNVTVFENIASPRKWSAALSVEEGGVMLTTEEFPFEAPEKGYQKSLNINQSTPHPPGWQDLFQGGQFYLKIDKGYGLLKLEQIVGKKTLRYSLAFNVNGERNLESE